MTVTISRRAGVARLNFLASLTALSAVLPVAAVATDASSVLSEVTARALRTCVAENQDSRRLACYDSALQRPAGRQTKTTPEQRFGLSAAQVVQKEQIAESPKNITAKVAAVGRGSGGVLTVTLDNGQVWAQQSADGQELPIGVGDSASVSHELMGGFLLTSSAGGHRSMRVRRIH
jgi:hypothetical protein